ncbi:myosin-binding protein H-like isoform X2 [Liolophura sinensis]|uniref:myosin-binding protein H-like isoform X2 n=1 Tax=Liolophura sinensis TaxID=3198878 RepID=UPI00315887B2
MGTPRQKALEEIEVELPQDEPPDFSFSLRPRVIQAGVGFKLLCCVQARPHPKVTWYKNGRELRSDDHYDIIYSSGVCSLEVLNAEVEDTATYKCIAINELGEEETSCRVVVEERFQKKPKGLSQEKDSLLTTGVSRSVRRTKSGAMMDEFETDDGMSVRHSKRTEEYF